MKNIKLKLLSSILLIFTGLFVAPIALAFTSSAYLYLDGQRLEEANCYEENQRTMVPVRLISENLGARVEWQDPHIYITLNRDDTPKTIQLTVKSATALVNGEAYGLDAAPSLKDGITYLPLRFVGEQLGIHVNYTDGIPKIPDLDTDFSKGLVYLWTKEPKASHSGNAQNGCRVIRKGDILYYIEDGSLYKKDLETGASQLLTLIPVGENKDEIYLDGQIYTMDIYEDRIYCTQTWGQILAVDLNTRETTLIKNSPYIDNAGRQVLVYGGMLYYGESYGKHSYCGRIDLKTLEDIPLGQNSLFSIDQDNLYAVRSGAVHEPGIVRLPVVYDASATGGFVYDDSAMRIYTGKASYYSIIDGDYIYFIINEYTWESDSSLRQLCRIQKDGSHFQALFEGLESFNVQNGVIYYITDNKTGPGDLRKHDIASGEDTLLAEATNDGSFDHINLLGDDVYYTLYTWDESQQRSISSLKKL